MESSPDDNYPTKEPSVSCREWLLQDWDPWRNHESSQAAGSLWASHIDTPPHATEGIEPNEAALRTIL